MCMRDWHWYSQLVCIFTQRYVPESLCHISLAREHASRSKDLCSTDQVSESWHLMHRHNYLAFSLNVMCQNPCVTYRWFESIQVDLRTCVVVPGLRVVLGKQWRDGYNGNYCRCYQISESFLEKWFSNLDEQCVTLDPIIWGSFLCTKCSK